MLLGKFHPICQIENILHYAKKNPWQLHLSKPAYGNPSGIWTIPAGTGFEDEKGNYLGLISIGFDVEKLNNYLIKKINHKHLSFVVIDLEANIIFQSNDNIFFREDNFFKNNYLNKINNFKESTGDLEIEVKDVVYTHYQLINNYDYVLLTGFNNKYLAKEFYNQVINVILFFFTIAILFLLILYLLRSLQISNTSKSNLIRATSHDLNNYLYSISGIAKLLIKEKKLVKIILLC